MHSWRVGDVELSRIEEFDVALPSDTPLPEWMVPSFAPTVDEYRVVNSVIAIRDGATRIIADPYLISNRRADDAATASRQLLDVLDDAGFAADEVDFVVNSHLDGLGWNTVPADGGWALAFPNATYLYPVETMEAVARRDELNQEADDLRQLASLTEVVSVDDEIALTPSVSVVRSGGHGAAHQVIRIESDGDLAIYLGHVVAHTRQLPDPDLRQDANADEVVVRRRLLGELADRGGLALTSLVGGPGGGRVVRDGTGFRV